MKHPRSQHLRSPAIAGLLALGGTLFAAGCATVPPPPTAALDAAATAIANAEQARAPEYAALELSSARNELTAARAAAQQQRMVVAEQLAQESRAGAELASARAEAAKARAVNEELQTSIDALKQEMQRNPGARP